VAGGFMKKVGCAIPPRRGPARAWCEAMGPHHALISSD